MLDCQSIMISDFIIKSFTREFATNFFVLPSRIKITCITAVKVSDHTSRAMHTLHTKHFLLDI